VTQGRTARAGGRGQAARAALLLALLAGAGPAAGAERAVEARVTKRYPIAGHGVLVIDVPASWKDQVVPAPNNLTIIFAAGSAGSSSIALNLMQNPSLPKGFNSAENIRVALSGVANRMALASNATKPGLESIRGTSGAGYYFSTRFHAMRSGDLTNLTQGQLGLIDMLLTFNVFSQDPDTLRDAVAMVREARWSDR